jgi:hypothetical protein
VGVQTLPADPRRFLREIADRGEAFCIVWPDPLRENPPTHFIVVTAAKIMGDRRSGEPYVVLADQASVASFNPLKRQLSSWSKCHTTAMPDVLRELIADALGTTNRQPASLDF